VVKPTEDHYLYKYSPGYSFKTVNGIKIPTGGNTRSGRTLMMDSTDPDYEEIDKLFGASRHMTYVFNIFVMMTIFNFLNARKIKDEINFLAGFFNNYLFLIIVAFIFFG